MSSCGNAPEAPSQSFPAGETVVQAPDAQALFAANCASCHKIDRDAIGPALKGALGRWDNDTARIKSFIRSSTQMIERGDPYAVELYEKWNKTAMYSFPKLKGAELDSLLTLMK